jgi:hypothetical protein
MPDGILGPAVEYHVPEMRKGIQAAQVRLTKIHQNLVCTLSVSGVFSVNSSPDRIGIQIWVVRVRRQQHLFHFESRPTASRDDWFSPLVNRLAFFAPLLSRRPYPSRRESQLLHGILIGACQPSY